MTSSHPDHKAVSTETIRQCLTALWHSPFSTKSDFAREFADELAACACAGFATTATTPGDPEGKVPYGRLWKLTPKGLALIWGE